VLQIRFHEPTPGLKQIVRFYIQRNARITGPIVVHPVPARVGPLVELIFGDQVKILDHAEQSQRMSGLSVVVGPQTYRRLDMQLHGNLESFVIMFQPDGLHRLFGIPMHELTDRDVEGHAVFGTVISCLRERLGNACSFEERVRLADEILLSHALRRSATDGISAASQWVLRSRGQVNISELAGHSGLGLRQFERRFIQQIGVRPKLFARIARFEGALERKARFAAKTWVDVAHEFGYYDQMHMIHDFATFTNGTPSEALAQLEAVYVEQIRMVRMGDPSAASGRGSRLIL
jgi:AraC-like DNA-binding protein